MKVGIMSDIHANPYGLQAVLDVFRSHKVEKILCAGDLTGYSPLVNETLELLLSQPVEFILGNHDDYLLNGCPPTKSKIVQKSVQTTRQIIRPEFVEFLRNLRPERLIDLGGYIVRMIHGGPANPLEEYVYPDRRIEPDKWQPGPERLIVLGHTHHQMLKKFDQITVLNPGSCGQPRDGRGVACLALLDTFTGSIHLERVPYDTSGMISTLKNRHWPSELLKYF